MSNRSHLALAVAAIAALHGGAAADDADTLFKKGKALMAAGRIAEACEAFDASDAKVSRVGTLLNLGECREQNQQIATAWSAFLRAAALAQRTAKDHDRAAEARRRAGYLLPRLSYLTISVSEQADLPGLVILRDGVPVDKAHRNQGVPVDGGTYVIDARLGDDTWSKSVIVPPENARISVDIPQFKNVEELRDVVAPPAAEAGAEAEAGAGAEAGAEVEAEAEAAVAPPRRRLTRLRMVGLGSAALGVAALGAATYFGLSANQLAADARAACCDSPAWHDLDRRAERAAGFTNAALITGAVAVGGAITLWIVGRPDAPASMRIVPRAGADEVGVSLHLEL
jgi:tetratricopeptide (TPR) repeat protein